MNKRTESIRSMFSVSHEEASPVDNKPPMLPRVSSGAVRSLRDTFSGVERENEELRARLASGQVVVELDPNLIDPSPLADRFREQETAPFEALKASIRERGQEIPILVREHPEVPGRYQSAYGHRRVRAAQELAIRVRAHVRELSDEDLVVAQGLENSAREDLSFIERAVFAAKLEDAGFQRSVIQTALSVDRAEVSKLVSVARAIPGDVVEAVGRAPKVGRGRWQALADAMTEAAPRRRARSAIKTEKFAELSSDARFLAMLSAANKSDDAVSNSSRSITSAIGTEIARVVFTETQIKLTVSLAGNEGFATFLVDKLPELFDAYAKTATPEDHREV
jgi:ParB family transcriptional regulator, chromosome partitioning protein